MVQILRGSINVRKLNWSPNFVPVCYFHPDFSFSPQFRQNGISNLRQLCLAFLFSSSRRMSNSSGETLLTPLIPTFMLWVIMITFTQESQTAATWVPGTLIRTSRKQLVSGGWAWVSRHHHHDDDEVWTNQATECNGSSHNRDTEEHLIVDWILSQNSRLPHKGREKKRTGYFYCVIYCY